MPFQEGNQHGAKPRLWSGALHRAIQQDDGRRIRAAAEKLLDLAANGEAWAVKELADRLDGKPGQNLTIGSDPENPFKIELERAKELEGKIRGLVVKDCNSA